MHPYDVPDVAHPPVPQAPEPEHHVWRVPADVSPEWINAEALHAAVATAQHEVTAGETPWSNAMIIELAKVYREFIKGEMD